MRKNPTKENATSSDQPRPTCKLYQCELMKKILSKINDDVKRF